MKRYPGASYGYVYWSLINWRRPSSNVESGKKRQDLLQLDWHFEGDIKDYRSPNILSPFLRF